MHRSAWQLVPLLVFAACTSSRRVEMLSDVRTALRHLPPDIETTLVVTVDGDAATLVRVPDSYKKLTKALVFTVPSVRTVKMNGRTYTRKEHERPQSLKAWAVGALVGAITGAINSGKEPDASAAMIGALAGQQFPWPPPQWSSSYEIQTSFAKGTKLSNVVTVFAEAFVLAGYPGCVTFAIPDGIALVTPLEQTDTDGNPMAPPDRWTTRVPPLRQFSINEYLTALIRGRTGVYRAIVIVVTSQPVSGGAPATAAQMNTLAAIGGLSAPDSASRQNLSSSQRVYALVYEFRKSENDTEPQQITPSTLSAKEHLRRSGFMTYFQQIHEHP